MRYCAAGRQRHEGLATDPRVGMVEEEQDIHVICLTKARLP
jgi:hypothetical protein